MTNDHGPSASTDAGGGNAARLGILLMLLAILMFAINDTLGKWLVSTYSVGQLLFIRSIAGMIVLLPLIIRAGWRTLIDVPNRRLLVGRGFLAAAEVGAFYLTVRYLPLADTITFWMAAPIYVAALSPLLLGEKVGWRRWTAIAVGFVGVIIAMEPSSQTLSLPALVAVVGSGLFALLMISGRALRGTSDLAMVFWPIFISGIGGALTIPLAWTAPTGVDVAMLALLGVVALAAHFLTNRSLSLADASVVTPYQYTLLVWAVIFGYLFFGETPRPAMLIGGAIIVASGLYIFFRGAKLGRKAVMEPGAGPAG
ncbi:MAG: EamA family transporter [Mesorhizobium sp.]